MESSRNGNGPNCCQTKQNATCVVLTPVPSLFHGRNETEAGKTLAILYHHRTNNIRKNSKKMKKKLCQYPADVSETVIILNSIVTTSSTKGLENKQRFRHRPFKQFKVWFTKMPFQAFSLHTVVSSNRSTSDFVFRLLPFNDRLHRLRVNGR